MPQAQKRRAPAPARASNRSTPTPGTKRPGESAEPDQPIVGMTNSAESLMPEGQREVTVFVFV